jgi:hypothetical protein
MLPAFPRTPAPRVALAVSGLLLDMEAKPGASAEDLSALPDATVDVVTTRSMLIYVAAKRQAFAEFSASYHLR